MGDGIRFVVILVVVEAVVLGLGLFALSAVRRWSHRTFPEYWEQR